MIHAVDPHAPDFIADPYPTFERLRDEAPLFWNPAPWSFWIVTRYADVRTLASDTRRFSSVDVRPPITPPTTRQLLGVRQQRHVDSLPSLDPPTERCQ